MDFGAGEVITAIEILYKVYQACRGAQKEIDAIMAEIHPTSIKLQFLKEQLELRDRQRIPLHEGLKQLLLQTMKNLKGDTNRVTELTKKWVSLSWLDKALFIAIDIATLKELHQKMKDYRHDIQEILINVQFGADAKAVSDRNDERAREARESRQRRKEAQETKKLLKELLKKREKNEVADAACSGDASSWSVLETELVKLRKDLTPEDARRLLSPVKEQIQMSASTGQTPAINEPVADPKPPKSGDKSPTKSKGAGMNGGSQKGMLNPESPVRRRKSDASGKRNPDAIPIRQRRASSVPRNAERENGAEEHSASDTNKSANHRDAVRRTPSPNRSAGRSSPSRGPVNFSPPPNAGTLDDESGSQSTESEKRILCVDANNEGCSILAQVYLELLRIWTANITGRWLFTKVESAGLPSSLSAKHATPPGRTVLERESLKAAVDDFTSPRSYFYTGSFPYEKDSLVERIRLHRQQELSADSVRQYDYILCFDKSTYSKVKKLETSNRGGSGNFSDQKDGSEKSPRSGKASVRQILLLDISSPRDKSPGPHKSPDVGKIIAGIDAQALKSALKSFCLHQLGWSSPYVDIREGLYRTLQFTISPQDEELSALLSNKEHWTYLESIWCDRFRVEDTQNENEILVSIVATTRAGLVRAKKMIMEQVPPEVLTRRSAGW